MSDGGGQPALVLSLAHLNLAVADLDRSIGFYRRWFGFTAPPRTYPDGTVFLGNDEGFDLALHVGQVSEPPGQGIHFGFRAPSPTPVRALLADLRTAAVPVIEHDEDPDYVGLKCRDPDGYVIEVYWERGATS